MRKYMIANGNKNTAVYRATYYSRPTRMWADTQRDGRPAEYRWRPLFNAAKFG